MHTKTHKRQHESRLWPMGLGWRPPPRGTIAHPRSSPSAQPLEQHGLGRASYPILPPEMDASHHVEVAPLAGSHAPRHAATLCTHTPR